MMARKLSRIGRRGSPWVLTVVAALTAQVAWAQSEIGVTSPNSVVDNPFYAAELKPVIVPEEPQPTAKQTVSRAPKTYQNPFANSSNEPPIDSSLRPGPVSRWRRPSIRRGESSTIKTALLNPAQGTAPTPAHPGWDQLPPGEALRRQVQSRGEPTDPTFFDRLTASDPTIRFNPTPLTQPGLVTAEPPQIVPLPPVAANSPAPFEEPKGAAAIPSQAPEAVPANPIIAKSDQMSKAFDIGPLGQKPTPAPAIVLPKVEDDLPMLVSDAPETAEDWLALAQDTATDAVSAEELTAVIESCEGGIHLGPPAKLLTSLRKLSAWAHNRRGELLSDSQHSDEAIKDFQAAITMDATCSLAIHNRAVTLAQRNQFAAALRDFNRVIELNPGLAVAYRNRAELLSALGRTEEAVADYSRAIDTLPEDPSLLLARARGFQRIGDFAHAAADINRAVDLSPNDPDTVTQRGNLAAEQGKFASAQDDFQKAIQLDANWGEAYRSLAWLSATCPQQQFRNPPQAVALAEQAAQLAGPDDYLVLDTLATAHASARQFEKAVKFEEQALAAAPRDSSTPLERRLAMYRNGQDFTAAPTPSAVRTASHESTEPNAKKGPRPSPSPRQLQR